MVFARNNGSLVCQSGGRWWIQRSLETVITKIKDFKWKECAHLGEEYAALMVESQYSPPQI